MTLPKVSIVVPVYNAKSTLEQCIKSILDIDYPEDKLEIIFVDNGSSDESNQILNKYNSRIIILGEKTKGASAARNKGILSSKGEVIAFTDSDCVVHKDWVKNIVLPAMEKEIGIAGGKILALNSDNKVARAGERIHDHRRAFSDEIPHAISMNWASRKKVLIEAGLFDINFLRSQDTELSLRIYNLGYKFKYCDDAIIYHKNSETCMDILYKGYLGGFYATKLHTKHSSFYKDSVIAQNPISRFWHLIKYIRGAIRGETLYNSTYIIIHYIGRIAGLIHGNLKLKRIKINNQ